MQVNNIKKEISVKLNTVSNVKRFTDINQISKCDTMLEIADAIKMPADSIMTLFSINLLDPIKEVITGEDGDVKRLLGRYRDENISFTEYSKEGVTDV